MEDSLSWYVVQTKAKQERIACENLMRQGYRVYLPHLKVMKRIRHRREVRLEPMFPRYLFFRPASENQSIACVRSTFGVTAVVRFGQRPAVLRPEVLEMIRTMESMQHNADAEELNPIQPGKRVVVVEGPFSGLEGLVSAVSSKRTEVLMNLLGSDTKVCISADSLEVLE